METDDELPRSDNSTRPEVIVDFVFDDGLFFVRLENIGERPAHKVTVRFDHPLIGAAGKEISALPLFRNVEFLAPHKGIVAFLDTSAAFFKREGDPRISALITYEDAEGSEHQTTIRHDLGIYREIAYVVKPSDQIGRISLNRDKG
jgi:hypothetical protein